MVMRYVFDPKLAIKQNQNLQRLYRSTIPMYSSNSKIQKGNIDPDQESSKLNASAPKTLKDHETIQQIRNNGLRYHQKNIQSEMEYWGGDRLPGIPTIAAETRWDLGERKKYRHILMLVSIGTKWHRTEKPSRK